VTIELSGFVVCSFEDGGTAHGGLGGGDDREVSASDSKKHLHFGNLLIWLGRGVIRTG
jgi:hypothetical protein